MPHAELAKPECAHTLLGALNLLEHFSRNGAAIFNP